MIFVNSYLGELQAMAKPTRPNMQRPQEQWLPKPSKYAKLMLTKLSLRRETERVKLSIEIAGEIILEYLLGFLLVSLTRLALRLLLVERRWN
jgi:hypothetical protein